jgi:DNA-binding NarL/FixJ family response regulator
VVLADDQAVVRDGLVLLLSASPDVEVVAAAPDGASAVELVRTHRPDVALLDLRMPGLDGAGATAAITAELPQTRVLILTTFADDDAILPALRAGAAGYLTKDASGEQLVGAIRDVAAGRTVLDPHVQRRLVELVAGAPSTQPAARPDPAPATAAPEAPDGLTRREIDVVRLVAEGLTNRQVAQRLVLSEATVKTHLNHILAKLDVDGHPGLVAWAWRHGLGGTPATS